MRGGTSVGCGRPLSLTLALQIPPGIAQFALLAVAMFLVAGTCGPSGAVLASLTPMVVHGSAFAAMTLTNNVIGLAPGPIITGRLADSIGLHGALLFLALPCFASAIVFALILRTYQSDLDSLGKRLPPQN